MPRNKPSPYPCQNLNGIQLFTTDRGVEYAMGFRNVSHFLSPFLGIYDIRVYTFDLFASEHSQGDPRVAPTIQGAVQDFFTDANRVLTYICDSGDDRAAQRQRLFTHWAANMDHLKIVKVEVGADPDIVYAGILTHHEFRHWDVLSDELFDPLRGISGKFGA